MRDNLTETSENTNQTTWLSIGEAAELLGLSRDTLRRWEKVGKIKVYRSPTNRRIYKQSDLEELYKTKGKKNNVSTQVDQPNIKLETAEIKNPLPNLVSSVETTEIPKEELEVEPPILTPVPTLEIGEEKNNLVTPLADTVSQVPTSTQPSPPIVKTLDSDTQPTLDSTPSVQNEVTPDKNTARMKAQPLQPREGLRDSLTMPVVPLVHQSPLPATPALQEMNDDTPNEGGNKKTESNSAKLLKAVAITLALILVGLGITITILVFA